MSLSRLYPLVTIVNIVIFSLLYIFIPGLRDSLTKEDQFMEHLTSILFLNAFLLSAFFVTKLKGKPSQALYLIIPIVSLIFFLDETSFGERIFHFTPPVIMGVRVDALHDFIQIAYLMILSLPKSYLLLLLPIFVLAIGTIVLIMLLKYKRYLKVRYVKQLSNLLSNYPPFNYLLVTVVFVSVAMIVDLDMINNKFLFFLEELLEMNAGLSLVFASFALRLETKKRQHHYPNIIFLKNE